MVAIADLQCEYRPNPLGIDVTAPPAELAAA